MHLSSVAALTIALFGVVYAREIRKPGDNYAPYRGATAAECQGEGFKFPDANNMCVYHQCVISDVSGAMELLPRPCALGSRIDYYFEQGHRNPCTINFDSVIGYECGRTQESSDVPPPCATDGSQVCYNGGTLTFEAGNCWCLCEEAWSGDVDCSKPTGYSPDAAPGSSICVDGEPLEDHCRIHNGCLNEGVCYNQCDTFWCDCPDKLIHNYVGKRCEKSY